MKRLTPVMERQLMLACRKNRSLSTAAQALWEIVREEGENLTAAGLKIRYISADREIAAEGLVAGPCSAHSKRRL